VDAGESNLRMAVRGTGRNITLLTGMEARILSRYPVFDGPLVQSPRAGAVEVIAVSLISTSPDPWRDSLRGKLAISDPYFADNVVTVNPGEIVVFDVKVLAQEATMTGCWILAFNMTVRNRR
jgi:hypothetical protein